MILICIAACLTFLVPFEKRGEMEDDRREHCVPPFFGSLLWALFRFAMYVWAVNGPHFLISGVLAHFFDVRTGVMMDSEDIMYLGGAVGCVGLSFVWMHKNKYISFVGEKQH